MSRIDDALRISEAAHGSATAEIAAFEPAHDAPLSQYRYESPVRLREVLPPTRPVELEKSLSPAPVSAPRKPPFSADADLQARLVTGTSNNLSREQYRKLGAVLHEAQIQNHSKTVMITSALPHEGKSLTVVNLALTLSESYALRVLVIDADLRAPSLHTILDIPNDRGLSEALRDGRHELPFTPVRDGLWALTAGTPGSTPLAGLSSKRMGEVLEECAAHFDWVLIDTPPVGVLPDAQVLTRLVGEVILVIRAGSTPLATIERTVAVLGGPEAISGTVLNRVEEWRIPDVDHYGRYYDTSHTRRGF
jgi:capsular exopolysaccharide synthesis family protein